MAGWMNLSLCKELVSPSHLKAEETEAWEGLNPHLSSSASNCWSCVYQCGGQRSILAIALSGSLCYFLRQGLNGLVFVVSPSASTLGLQSGCATRASLTSPQLSHLFSPLHALVSSREFLRN